MWKSYQDEDIETATARPWELALHLQNSFNVKITIIHLYRTSQQTTTPRKSLRSKLSRINIYSFENRKRLPPASAANTASQPKSSGSSGTAFRNAERYQHAFLPNTLQKRTAE